ncbi:MAG: hypothetical protein Q8O98_02025 [bacterium]|nr:hypothetical protein [bacterium]
MAIHSPEYVQRRRQVRKVRAIVALILLLILLGALTYLSHLERLLIDDVKYYGNVVTKDEEVSRIVEEHLSGKYLWLFPRANAFLYPKRSIEHSLLSGIPRLESLDLELNGLNTLNVTLRERVPKALYCEDITDITMPTGCYFLDSNGYIFSKAPAFSGAVYFIYSNTTALERPLDKQYLSQKEFLPIARFIEKLVELGVRPRAFIKTGDEYHLVLNGSGKVMWKADEDINSVALNLEAFLYDEVIAAEEDFLEQILYIDLRFRNKVFYKLK